MSRLTRLAAKLYPRWWRERYGDEFNALLDDARPGLGGTVDVFKGAVAMQISTFPSKRVLAFGALTGLAIGFFAAVWMPKRYSSSAVVTLDVKDPAQAMKALAQKVLSRAELAGIVRGLDLYRGERNRQPAEAVLETMKKSIRLTPVRTKDGSMAAEVRFDYADGVGAQRVVMALVTKMIDASPGAMELYTPASLPMVPLSPDRTMLSAVGLGSGALSVGLVGWLGARKRRRATEVPAPPRSTPEI
jgi:hypothetical protein